MKDHPQSANLAQHNPWRQVLSMGEKLIQYGREHRYGREHHIARQESADQPATDDLQALQSLEAQHELIQQTTARLLSGASGAKAHATAQLFIPEDVVAGFLGHAGRPQHLGAPLSGLMRCALEKCQLCGGQDTQSDLGVALLGSDCAEAYTQPVLALAVPLTTSEEDCRSLGVLQVERPPEAPFQLADVELLEGLAAQAALALQTGLQTAKEHRRLEQLSLVRQVSAQIAQVRDLNELTRQVTALIQATFRYYYVAIFTLEAGQDILHYRAGAGSGGGRGGGGVQPGSQPSFAPSLVVQMGQGIVGHVAQSGAEILANDVLNQQSYYRHVDVLPETRSEVALPLLVEGRLVGVLDVQSDQADYFGEDDLLVLRALAGGIAVAIEGAQLYSTLHQRATQLSTLYEVSNAIASILDTENLLDEVCNLIEKRFGFLDSEHSSPNYRYVHLFSVHPGRRKIFYEAGSGATTLSRLLRQQEFAYDLDDSHGLIPWVARTGQMVITNDVSQEPRYRPSALPPENTRSEMTVPLIFGGQVLGVLDVQSEHLGAFSQEDGFLFKALADNVAVAMRNAALYRSEVWRRQAADSLREVAGLLSANVDLQQVLEAILTELQRNLPLDVAAIWLSEEDDATEQNDSEASPGPALHLAAVHGDCIAELDIDLGLSPQDVLEFNPADAAGITPEQAAGWLIQALQAEQPVIRDGHSSYDPLGAALGFPLDYSAIAAPLRIGGAERLGATRPRNLGVLTLAHNTPGRYGSESQTMTAAFASYAAVAIENTRLYEDAHEQAWVSTVLLQVAEATQSITDLHELLATVIRITPTLAGVKACLLYILEEGLVFIPAVASGLTPAGQTEFERWLFNPGVSPAFDQLLAGHRPVILHLDDNPELARVFFQDNKSQAAIRSELLVLVPLLAHSEVFGAFLVEYSPSAFGASGTSLEAFFDQQLAIIQGIAHQTAIAVENIRLIKSQREEAYISVALLQVAQAVVSSQDLDEALGSIVRITPILVGVRRVAVFLLDAAQNVFHLSQTYGIPRDLRTCQYTRSEFPLLDAVYERDSLVAYPLAGGEDDFSDVPDDWSFLIPPDPEEIELFVENSESLLLAFPLSVKGAVLGVMLVEEPDPRSAENVRNNSGRGRSKRLEIITGISQQAALAIQNDLLQRKTVERERLEREMQLARDIQRTFLPETTPNFPDWDLKVRWRTAREVGGDFYDFFELPGRRLGLVIADVADKGMPAALYMTMVRTLMRATMQQVEAPWEVLERVNDILVPDAPQGMFVTLAYAVIQLDSGEVQFANAGHNPPLWVQPDGHGEIKLERLTRGNMALGVMEAMHMEGRQFTLQAGETLVMYTDGVTEAFSPAGDLFGEERLLAVIEQAASSAGGAAAQEMLDAIDHAVTQFIGAAQLSDDLTLLVIRRT